MTAETPPPLLDKRGRPLRGNARAVAEAKLRDGKGPRVPAARTTAPPPREAAKGTSLADRLRRIL